MRIATAIGIALSLGSCGQDDGGAKVIYGYAQDLGTGTIRNYFAVGADGTPTSVGADLAE